MVLKRSLEREDVLAKLFERYLHIKAADSFAGIELQGLHYDERVAAGEAVAEMYYNGENGEAFSLAEGAFRTAETFTPRPLIYAVTGGPNHD